MPGIKASYLTISDAYLALIQRFPLRPIREADILDLAIELVAELGRRGERGELTGDEADYLNVLITLVEQFEDANEPIL